MQEVGDYEETRAERKARLKAETAAAASEAKKGKGGRKLTARCWMAEDFPLSLQQLAPVLDVIGHANKYVAKVCSDLSGALLLHAMVCERRARADGMHLARAKFHASRLHARRSRVIEFTQKFDKVKRQRG